MRNNSRRWLVALLLCFVVVLLICPGCGGSSGLPAGNNNGQNPNPTTGGDRNVLQTHMPPLQGLTAGAEFEYSIDVAFQDALYQGSGRIVYDASVMQPIEAVKGSAIPADDIFVAKLDASPQVLPGSSSPQSFVPFAFTGLPGSSTPSKTTGELIKVKFRLLQTPPPTCHVSLLNDATYLQLRSPQATRLPFDLQMEVTQQ